MLRFSSKSLIIASAAIVVILLLSNAAVRSDDVLRISTTTSLQQIGLVDALMKDFMMRQGVKIRYEVIVSGSGEALRLLGDGTTCIAFTHAPSLEYTLINKGTIRRLGFVGFNEFVIVGPNKDPADVLNARNAVDAFSRIYRMGELGLTKFISRGDNSGTHIREILIWNLSGLNPKGRSWYLETGQGMQQALIIADDVEGYTLSDLGTYVKLLNANKLRNTVILLKDSTNLINVYSLYASNSDLCRGFTPIIDRIAAYVMSDGQNLLIDRFEGLVKPFKGHEDLVNTSWNYLAVGRR